MPLTTTSPTLFRRDLGTNQRNFAVRISTPQASGFESLFKTNGGKRGRHESPTARKMEAVIKYMILHLSEPQRISTLSNIAGLSASQFISLFKRISGCSPMNFFIRLRMQRACELLRDRELRIKEVAFTLGYKDPFYFSRMFKTIIGVSPNCFRKMVVASTRGESKCAKIEPETITSSDLMLSRFLSNRAFKHHDLNGVTMVTS